MVASGVVTSELPSGFSWSPPATPELLCMRAREGVTFRSSSGERNSLKEKFAEVGEHLYVGEEEG